MSSFMKDYNKWKKTGSLNKEKKSLIKTGLTAANYLGQGALKGAESVFVDAPLQIAGGVKKLFGDEKGAKNLFEAANVNLTNAAINKLAGKEANPYMTNNQNLFNEQLDKNSLIKENNIGGKVVQGIGEMLPTIALTGGISGVGKAAKTAKQLGTARAIGSNALLGTKAFTGATNEAYQESGDIGKSMLYGLGNAAVEIGTEQLSGGIPGLKQIKGDTTKNILKNYGKSVIGEGVEEIVSDLANPLLQTIYKGKDALKQYGDSEYWKGVAESGLVGSLTGGILDAPNTISSINTNKALTKASKQKIPGMRTEQSISNNIEELKQEQQATTDNKLKQELASEINSLEEQLEKQGTRILEETEAKRQGMINNFKEYLEENNIANPTQQDIDDSIIDLLGYDNELDYTDTLKEEKLYNQYVKEYMKENGIPFNNTQSLKTKQLDIIKKTNPMKDDYHTGIRNIDDIKTFEEVINDDESFTWGDYTKEDAIRDLQKGSTTVYSSYPIENGNFVSTSKNQARDYAGGENAKIYSKEVPLTDVAWINGDEGQYAKSDDIKDEKPNLPKSKSLPMVKEEPVLKVNASEIANEMNSVNRKRGWIGTAAQSDVLKDTTLIKDLDTSKLSYVVESNQKSVDTANNHLDTYGYEKSLEDVKSMLRSDKLPKASDVALAERLLQEAIKNGDTKTAQDLIMDIAILGTDLGQATQALSMINRLTPEGQLKMYTKIIERAKARGDKAYQDVEITTDMVQNVLDAYNEDGTYDQQDLNNRVENFKQEIANQMKTTVGEKINAWRYLSMLGNPKTHIRNIVSNVAMNGTIKVKNAMARTLESVLPIANRTKTWKKASTEIQNYANKTAEEMKGIITGENKYNEKTALETKKQVFKNKTLEKLSDFNSNALEDEDWFFSKKAFKSTLQEYLTANGINTLEDIKNNPEVVEKAKIYAVEQAEIATFRQYSKLASAVNSLEKNNKAARLFIEATMPFKKTPINVAKAGVKYSPLGLIKAISYDIYQVKRGNMEASQFIDNLSQGLTGTSLAILGYALAKAGILNGAGGDDDKEGKYDSQLGDNQYSLKIGDKSYSISWLSPVAMPLLVGANAYEQLEEKEEWDMNVVSDTLAKTLDPLNEMSFMQGLTNALTSYGSGVDKIKGSLESVGQNYVGQFFPTLFSQFASTIDDKKRSTKASANSTYKFGEQTLRSVMYKLPGLRQQLEVATDIWGNEKEQADNIIQRAYESFIAPYSTTKNITSDLDKELKRVYNKTGETGVIPSVPYAYVKYGDETYRMSAKEYTQYKKTYGQTSYKLLNNTIQSQNYKTLSDEEKANVLENIFGYSKYVANKEYFNNTNTNYTSKEYDKVNLYSKVGKVSDYYLSKVKKFESDKDANGKTISGSAKKKVVNYINSLNASIPEKAMLIKLYGNFTFDDYNKQIIEYVNGKNITKSDKEELLTKLGFKIKDGRVYSK